MHKRLIVWPGLKRNGPILLCTFSIYLLSLDSSQALLDRVVTPAISLASLALLEENSIVGILPDWDGLVRYESEDVLTAGEEDA